MPTIAECLSLMDRYGMLDNIRRHSYLVTRVAETLVGALDLEAAAARRPDLALVRAGALLHDIAKTRCLDGRCIHAEEGQAICEDEGYHDVGVIVREHVILSTFAAEDYRAGRFTPREIVYYADKRVRHDEIVVLADRLDYILERYGGGNEVIEQRIRANFSACLELEDYLFGFIDFDPEELADRVTHAPF